MARLLVALAPFVALACSHDWDGLGAPGTSSGVATGATGPGGFGATGATSAGGLGNGGTPSAGGAGGVPGVGGFGGSSSAPTSTGVGGAGGTVTTCDQLGDCELCVDCASSGPCVMRFDECTDGCQEIVTCTLQFCDDVTDEACIEFCKDGHNIGDQNDYDDLLTCVVCDSCPSSCGAQDPCP